MLNLFEEIVDKNKLHSKFKLLCDVMMSNEREIISEWTEGFIDRDLKILTEFQTTFHSAFWEFYLYAVLKTLGCSIDFSKSRPDFIISSPYEFYIEAVVSEIKQNGRSEITRTLDDILSMIEPHKENENFKEFLNEAIARYSNSILKKRDKYKSEYLSCDWVNEDVPFVIALASYAQVNYGKEFHYPMLALLYGLYFDPDTDCYDNVSEITKPGTNSPIPVGLFNNDEFKDVSAIIFSCTLTLGKLTSLAKSKGRTIWNSVINIIHDQDEPHFKIQDVSEKNPEELSDGLFVFHNPYAKNKLSEDVFRNTNAIQIIKENGIVEFEGNNSPIVSRLNIYIHDSFKPQVFKEIFDKFNPGYIHAIFEVLEIDLDRFCEIELLNTENNCRYFVDILDHDIKFLAENNINEGDKVTGIIKSNLNEFGDITTFKLVSINKL